MSNTTPHSPSSFGIDHPLIAVQDIDTLRDRLISIGFNMSTIGKHPWGTSTSLAIFPNSLLEIMGIYDTQLLDEKPTGDFRFGRHVYEHLQQREGVALTALHSTHSVNDANHASSVGFNVAGHLEFGRDISLPDGTPDRTKTTLALLPDTQHPRLSFFLCQQHRRDLVEVPQWMHHPNTVSGIRGIVVLASNEQQPAVRQTLGSLYGTAQDIDGGFLLQTPNGSIKVLTASAVSNTLGYIPEPVLSDQQAAIVGMDFQCTELDTLENYLTQAHMQFRRLPHGLILDDPALTGNTFFVFSDR